MGPAGCGADQARRGDGDCRCGARHGHQAGNALRESAVAKAPGRPGARNCRDRLADAAGGGAAGSRDQEAEYSEQSRRQQASADKAYELQTNIMLQQVTAEQVKVQQVEKEGQIKVQEAEILRHEKELIATILKGSEIERQRIENMLRRKRIV